MYDTLQQLPDSGQATMVGYLLKNTVSLNGTVSRGVCKVKDGKLESIKETKDIQLYSDGSIIDLTENKRLDPDSVVSMNYWGFMPGIFPIMKEYFDSFLKNITDGDIKAECLLPIMVDDMMNKGKLEVSVLQSEDKWFGMTYKEDKGTVSKELRELHDSGIYPRSLRRI